MQRGSEILRQWNMLMAIAQSADRGYDSLVAEFGVKRRTVQRDLETLSLVFPLEDCMVDGRKVWRLAPKALSRIADAAFTLPELCAFYVHRGQLARAGGSAERRDGKAGM
jgi:predicted DNA-binding transcriptional regulator YafY